MQKKWLKSIIAPLKLTIFWAMSQILTPSLGTPSWPQVLERVLLKDLLKRGYLLRKFRSLLPLGGLPDLQISSPIKGRRLGDLVNPASSEPSARRLRLAMLVGPTGVESSESSQRAERAKWRDDATLWGVPKSCQSLSGPAPRLRASGTCLEFGVDPRSGPGRDSVLKMTTNIFTLGEMRFCRCRCYLVSIKFSK